MAEIIGADKLIEGLENAVSGMDLSQVLLQACLLVENDAKRKCPVGKGVESGILRNSITHEIEGNVGYVGTNIQYAPYVEYGTGIYAKNGDGRQTPWVYPVPEGYSYTDPKTGKAETAYFVTTVGQHPQPFLNPALDENKAAIDELFREYIVEELGLNG